MGEIVTKGGEETSCKVCELDDAVRNNCHFCEDFASELADMSVGSVCSPAGFSTVLVRSNNGKELFEPFKDTSEDSVSKEGHIYKEDENRGEEREGGGKIPPILESNSTD